MIAFIHCPAGDCVAICREGTYYHHLACGADPSRASARHQRDTELRPEIKRVWDENYQVYGVRKAWHQLKREGFTLARCTVERLMKQIDIRGAVRGKVVKTTVPDPSAPCPRDNVNRLFRAPAPNLLWVSDFTYVSTWQALVIDTFADCIVDWRSHGLPKRTLFSPIGIMLRITLPGNGCFGAGSA